MTIAAERPVIVVDCVCGHAVRSVVATNEPERHRARAVADLAVALPPVDRFDALDCRVARVVTTPDFHPGKPVPVGVVVDMVGGMMPHLIGNDIGCGMRMIALHDVDEADLTPGLDGHLRHVHFQGGRNIALTGHDRCAALKEGIPGLLESLGTGRKGLLSTIDMASAWRDVDRTADDGFFAAEAVDPDFAAFIDGGSAYRHDAIFGTIGGGNHFVEFGVVESIADGQFAAVAGLRRGTLVLVVHSGSLDFGQRVGSSIRQALNSAGRRGDARILDSRHMPELAARYANGLANAANAAFVNRLLIGLSAIEALQRTLGRAVGNHLVYDAPHNTIWREGETFRHRKGACRRAGQDNSLARHINGWTNR